MMTLQSAASHEYPASCEDVYERSPEDVTVQVQVNSNTWHRRMVGGTHTACDIDLTVPENRGGAWRQESYHDILCTDGCFSVAELRRSRALNAATDKETW